MKVGLTRINERHKDTIALVDIELHPDVEYAINRAITFFSEQNYPIFEHDVEDKHGPNNLGFISNHSFNNPFPKGSVYEAFNQSSVIFRISFGINRLYEDKGKKLFWNPKDITRLHLSICGKRDFFTDDQIAYASEKNHLCLNTETLLLSIRYIDGKFDDWTDGKKTFHNDRTTHLQYRSWQSYGAYICNNKDEAVNYIQTTGTRKPLLDGICKNREPLIGYETVLGFLSNYKNIDTDDFSKIQSMNYRQTIDYLLDCVAPGVKNFVTK